MSSKNTNSTILSVYVLTLLNVFFFFDIVLRVLPNIFVPYLQIRFHIGPTGLGFFSTAFMVGYGVAQIPAGITTDFFGIKYTLSGSLVSGLIALITLFFSQQLYLVLGARFILGTSFAFAFILCMKYITQYCAFKHQGKLTSLTMLIGATGGLFTNSVLAKLSLHHSHQAILAGIILLILLLFVLALFLPNLNTNSTTINAPKRLTLSTYLKQNISNRLLWQISIIAACLYLPYAILNDLWGVSFFQIFDHLNKLRASHIISGIWLGWIVGSILIGLLYDKLKTIKGILLTSLLVALFSLIPLVYIQLPFNALIGLAFCVGASASAMELCYLALPEQQNNALFIGFVNSIVTLFVVSALPLISNIISISHASTGTSQLHPLGLYPASAMQIGFVVLLVALMVGLAVVVSLPKHKVKV